MQGSCSSATQAAFNTNCASKTVCTLRAGASYYHDFHLKVRLPGSNTNIAKFSNTSSLGGKVQSNPRGMRCRIQPRRRVSEVLTSNKILRYGCHTFPEKRASRYALSQQVDEGFSQKCQEGSLRLAHYYILARPLKVSPLLLARIAP